MQQVIQLPWFGQIRSYTFFTNLGSVLGSLMVLLLLYYAYRNIRQAIKVFLLGLLLVLAGSFLGQFIRGLSYGNFEDMLDLLTLFASGHGIHFIGRVIVTIAFFPILYCKLFAKEKSSLNRDYDYICLFLAFQHMFNRLACLMNGCCYGKSYSGFGAMQFTWIGGEGPAISYPVYPTQLFEMTGMLVLFLLMLVLIKIGKHVQLVFGLGFSFVIFISEYMMDVTGTILIFGLTVIQIASLVLAVLSVFVWINTCRRADSY